MDPPSAFPPPPGPPPPSFASSLAASLALSPSVTAFPWPPPPPPPGYPPPPSWGSPPPFPPPDPSTAADNKALATLETALKWFGTYAVVWLAVFVWDTLATLPLEYKHVWKAKWSWVKGVYLVNRYWTLVYLIFEVVLLHGHVSPDLCGNVAVFQPAGAMITIIACGCILAIRLYALFDKSAKVLVLLLGLLFVEVGIMVGCTTQTEAIVLSAQDASSIDYIGCSVRLKHNLAALFWGATLVFEALCVGLLVYRVAELRRRAGQLPILKYLLRHGIFYFVVVFLAGFGNIVAFAQHDTAYQTFNPTGAIALMSLMASRLVLSLHASASYLTRSIPNLATYPLDAHHLPPPPPFSVHPAAPPSSSPAAAADPYLPKSPPPAAAFAAYRTPPLELKALTPSPSATTYYPDSSSTHDISGGLRSSESTTALRSNFSPPHSRLSFSARPSSRPTSGTSDAIEETQEGATTPWTRRAAAAGGLLSSSLHRSTSSRSSSGRKGLPRSASFENKIQVKQETVTTVGWIDEEEEEKSKGLKKSVGGRGEVWIGEAV